MQNHDVIVFDIGGTWFRSALYSNEGQLIDYNKVPAINFISNPDKNVSELQQGLVNYLLNTAQEVVNRYPNKIIKFASISMGAALNGHTGLILNSGPLWGPSCQPFDLLSELNTVSELKWFIANDITAALLASKDEYSSQISRRVSLITVSTGIGARIYDLKQNRVPLEPLYGIQGEIGHLQVHFEFRGHKIDLRCDCGGNQHLNAYCSGRGIEKVLREIAILFANEYKLSFLGKATNFIPGKLTINHFKEGIEQKDDLCLEILDTVTLPLAQTLVSMNVIDPELDLFIFTGGVTQSLGLSYQNSLIKNLERVGMYQITDKDQKYFSRKIVFSQLGDLAGLKGAASYALNQIDHQESSIIHTNWRIQATQEINYSIYTQEGLFKSSNHCFDEFIGQKALIFIDKTVNLEFGTQIRDFFTAKGVAPTLISLEVTESNKNIETVLNICSTFSQEKILRRSSPIIAIGGGVLLDIVGMAASIFRRGTPYIRVPTTLLGLIDAGVGIKTGVNHGGSKNRLGSYYAPTTIYLDKSFLITLPERHIINGMGEMLKIAIIMNRELFTLLENYGLEAEEKKFQGKEVFDTMLSLSIEDMLSELEPNLWEKKLERLVDFGHTFSPVIEMCALPELLHGEAVATDMCIASTLAFIKGKLSKENLDRILHLTHKLRLPVNNETCTVEHLMRAVEDATLHRDGLLRMPIPVEIGVAEFVNEVTPEELIRCTNLLKEYRFYE